MINYFINNAQRKYFIKTRTLHTDCNYVLSSSKYIKNSNTKFKVLFCKWLSHDELMKVKTLREKCSELNRRAVPLQDGKQPYEVRSGRFMTRNNNGKLQPASPADSKGINGKSPNKVTDRQKTGE